MVLGSRRAYSVDPDYDIISGSSRAARISSIAADDGATLSAMSRERDRRLMDNITTKMVHQSFNQPILVKRTQTKPPLPPSSAGLRRRVTVTSEPVISSYSYRASSVPPPRQIEYDDEDYNFVMPRSRRQPFVTERRSTYSSRASSEPPVYGTPTTSLAVRNARRQLERVERELGTVSDYPQTSVRTTAVTRGVPIMNSPSWYYTYYSPKYEAVNYDNYPSYSVTQRGYYPFYYPNKYSYQPYVPRYSNDVYTGSQPYIPKYYKAFADSGYPYIPRYYRQAATDRAYSLDLALPKKSAYSYEVAIPKKPTYSYSLAPATPTYSNDLYAARQSYSYNLTSSTPTYSIDYATPRVPTRVDSLDLATLPSRYRRPYSSVYPYYRTGVESLDLATLPSRYRRPFYAGYPYYGSVYSYPYTYGNWGKSQRRSLDAEVDAYLTGSRKYYPNLDYFYPFYDTPYRIAPSLYSIYGYRPYFSRTMRGSWEVDGFPYQHTSMTYIPVEVDTTSKASPKLYKSAGGRVARAFEDAEVDAYLNSEAPRRPPPKTELRTERSGALASVPSRGRSYSLPGGRPRSRVADLEARLAELSPPENRPPHASIASLRHKANEAKNKLDNQKLLLDRYLPVYMGPENEVAHEIDYKFGELCDRLPYLDPYRPNQASISMENAALNGPARRKPTIQAAPANNYAPRVSETRRKIREVLCHTKKDPRYFD